MWSVLVTRLRTSTQMAADLNQGVKYTSADCPRVAHAEWTAKPGQPSVLCIEGVDSGVQLGQQRTRQTLVALSWLVAVAAAHLLASPIPATSSISGFLTWGQNFLTWTLAGMPLAHRRLVSSAFVMRGQCANYEPFHAASDLLFCAFTYHAPPVSAVPTYPVTPLKAVLPAYTITALSFALSPSRPLALFLPPSLSAVSFSSLPLHPPPIFCRSPFRATR
eukprot:6206065-Pleurochrysis_carterae.AAC.2